MSMTDPIADLLTRIRNASAAKHQKVDVASSNLKVNIATVLREEGFIKNYKVIADNKQGILRIYLRYVAGKSAIRTLQRVSRPGLRHYVRKEKIPQVLRGRVAAGEREHADHPSGGALDPRRSGSGARGMLLEQRAVHRNHLFLAHVLAEETREVAIGTGVGHEFEKHARR